MKIINLIEDTVGKEGLYFEHGLSFYVETENHRLLLDTGASGDFVLNAEKLGIDLRKVDTLVLSHGHYDHTGGVMRFVGINPTAKIYLHKNAGGEYFNDYNSQRKYIGIDKKILDLPQLILTEGNIKIDDELFVFSDIDCVSPIPSGNSILKKELGGELVQDDFNHEQYLVVTSGGKTALLSGCAHRGILNIMHCCKKLFGSYPDYVVSGFHMMKKTPYNEADKTLAEETAKALKATGAKFFSGHCTGDEAMEILLQILGNKLTVMHSGDRIV
ncbi:MAG: MBL fold metallo-hydrolase [Clostridia bacterium]|nr:MBL fold metallo-hydrolase [Clostridia bacterium]MBR6634184.1 MBL fold metallo-hydrolase [Clostridia bacterium]